MSLDGFVQYAPLAIIYKFPLIVLRVNLRNSSLIITILGES